MKIFRIITYVITIWLSFVLSSIQYYQLEYKEYIKNIQSYQLHFWDIAINYEKNWNERKLFLSKFFFKELIKKEKILDNNFCYKNFEPKDFLEMKSEFKNKCNLVTDSNLCNVENYKELSNLNYYVHWFSSQLSAIQILSSLKYNKNYCLKISEEKFVLLNKKLYKIKLINETEKKDNYKIILLLEKNNNKWIYKEIEKNNKVLEKKLLKLIKSDDYYLKYTKWE